MSDFITHKERKALLIVGLATFIFSIAGFVSYNVKEDLKRAEYYRQQDENQAQGKPVFAGPYCFPDKHPHLLLKITGAASLTFLLLIFSKRYFLSTLSTFGLFGLFIAWYLATQNELRYVDWGIFQSIDRFFFKAGDFDLTVFILSIILLFWQFSILLRGLFKNSQIKNSLP